jgi:hypothetical protein
MRVSNRTGLLEISNAQDITITETIRATLELICESSCASGGWGFTSGCKTPNLYYTYAACEALADFGDYVMGETKDVTDEDKALVNILGEALIAKVNESRRRAAAWLIKQYLDTLGTELVDPYATGKRNPIHLYYTYFVIDALIVCNADTDEAHKDKRASILQKLEHAIYQTRIEYDRARADTDWWENANESALKLDWEKDHPGLKNLRAIPPLQEPGLVPLALRCNTLYIYYFSEGKDKKVGNLFQAICDDRDKATGLWDSIGYNLMVTERAVEAIVDYSDYLKKYARQVGESSAVESGFRLAVRGAVDEYLTSADGKLRLGATNSFSPAPSAYAKNDEREFAKCLLSVLTKGEQVMQGIEDPGLPEAIFSSLRQQFHKIMLFMTAEKMGYDKSGLALAAIALDEKEQQVLAVLKSLFANDPGIDLGDVVMHAVDKSSVSKATSAGTRLPKK